MRLCEHNGCSQPVWGTCKQSRKGYCKMHQTDRLDFNRKSITQRAIEKHKTQNKAQIAHQKTKPIQSPTLTDIIEIRGVSVANRGKIGDLFGEDTVKRTEMDLYWLSGAKELAKRPFCMECGNFIPDRYYRSSIAHCLPKRKEYGFPSVEANPINRLFLGTHFCGCHQKYDRSWEDAAQMKIFPLAIEIFKKLYPLIDKSERKNIPEVFRQEILR